MSKAREIETPSERCRICRCSFKVKYGTASQPGKPGYISSENLCKPSKRKDAREILADTSRAVGCEVVGDNELFLDRVCNPCTRKIRNLGTLYEFVLSSIGSEAAACKTPPKQRINASKRPLETPPGSSPCRNSVRVNSAKASRKSLFPSTAQQSQQALNDCIDSNLNIDDLPTDVGLQVKVVIMVNKIDRPKTRLLRFVTFVHLPFIFRSFDLFVASL